MSWIILAFISAATAALVAIFGKIGTQGIDSNVATAVRSIIMAVAVVLLVLFRGGFSAVSGFSAKAWMFIVLSGLSGAASWIAYFAALRVGNASKVAPIDRLSVVFTLLLAWIFLGERISLTILLGAGMMVAGSILILKG